MESRQETQPNVEQENRKRPKEQHDQAEQQDETFSLQESRQKDGIKEEGKQEKEEDGGGVGGSVEEKDKEGNDEEKRPTR